MTRFDDKKTADDFITEANVYALIGIDLAKCEMPLLSSRNDAHGHINIVGNPSSLGWMINDKLQPALRNLVQAIILDRSAKYFASGLHEARQAVGFQIAVLTAQRSHSDDGAAIDGLIEKLKGVAFGDLPAVTDKIAAEVSKKIAEKICVAELEAARGSTRTG